MWHKVLRLSDRHRVPEPLFRSLTLFIRPSELYLNIKEVEAIHPQWCYDCASPNLAWKHHRGWAETAWLRLLRPCYKLQRFVETCAFQDCLERKPHSAVISAKRGVADTVQTRRSWCCSQETQCIESNIQIFQCFKGQLNQCQKVGYEYKLVKIKFGAHRVSP